MKNNLDQTPNPEQSTESSEDLKDVKISDEDLENADQNKKVDSKEAKKRSKLLRTPEEKKRLKRRNTLIGAILVAVLVAGLLVLPMTRWAILNALGFRGELSILVQDVKTNETISQVNVVVDGAVVGSTDSSGQLSVSNVRLGARDIGLEKSGYSRSQQSVNVGTGITKYNATIEAIGLKVNISVKDWLSQKPIAKAALVAGDSKAITDSKGQAALIVSPGEEKVVLKVRADGYLSREVELDSNVASREVTLTSSAKNYFISKRDGKFDIFSSNIDGTNQKKIVEATGKENQNFLQFTINRSNKKAILVATREGRRLNNRIIAGVYKVDLEKASIEKIDEGSDVQILDWAGDSLVYTKTMPELKYDDKRFTRIVSYNVNSGNLNTRAEANYFQLASVVGEKLFYKPSEGSDLTSLDLGSGVKSTYLKDQPISYGVQTSYGVLQLETLDSQFYEINSVSGSTNKIDRQPGNSEKFALSQDGKRILFVDQRDGKGALVVQKTSSKDDSVVAKIGGLVEPVRWVNSSLAVARIATNQETADYVIDVSSGKFAKIVDVSNVGQSLYY